MRRWLVVLFVTALCFATATKKAFPIDGQSKKGEGLVFTDRVLVAVSGDIRSVLGPQGKSIAVSANGDAIAVIYGGPTGDPDNFMQVNIAYSTDDGATWTEYGPFSAFMRRIYPGVDGSSDFDTNPGELCFSWQESELGYAEGDHKVMIEENVPSAPSFSSPASLPSSSGAGLCPWFTCVAVDPDDPYNVVSSSFSYLNNGNEAEYIWISDDGGYTWTDTIFVCHAVDPISGSSGAGHLRRGPDGYMFFTFHDTVDIGIPVAYPHIIESTDGGYTWGAKQELNVPIIGQDAQFWWTELDCEYINGDLWVVHNDINQVFPDSGGFWCWHGTGSPGSWSWDVFNINDYAFETTAGDYYISFQPNQYPSVCHDPVSGIIAITFKAYYTLINTVTNDTIYDGNHVGAIYTTNNGTTWNVPPPLSTPAIGNQLINWNATETAHRLVNSGGDIWAYTVWIEDVTFNTYFELEKIQWWGIAGIDRGFTKNQFTVRPNIITDCCHVSFNLASGGNVSVQLFDETGRLVKQGIEQRFDAGNHTVQMYMADLAAGIYFVVLETDHTRESRKVIKVK